MLKVGKLINTEHQLYFTHGIHLTVCDVLFGFLFVKTSSCNSNKFDIVEYHFIPVTQCACSVCRAGFEPLNYNR